ncbi:hypothetical protein ABEY41_06175 [Peribacillus butanolivorans]
MVCNFTDDQETKGAQLFLQEVEKEKQQKVSRRKEREVGMER